MSEKYNGLQRKTNCGGHWYDSQLEAQWRVFFNDTGFSVTPHPATFRTGKWDQGKEIHYTPDFYLRDYNVFCEVKPSSPLLANRDIQRKISAAMEGNFTPVGKGLMILGSMSGFKSNETKKCCLSGEFYQWFGDAIWKSYWHIGKGKNAEVELSFDMPDWSDDSKFSHFPCLNCNPSADLLRSYTSINASEVVYHAIFDAIYADTNGQFIYESDDNKEEII